MAIGICVFITYISKDVDQSTILFNLSFLAVMVLAVIIAFVAGLRHLIQDCRGLQHGIDTIRNGISDSDSSDRTSLFQNDFLDHCYTEYRLMVKDHPQASCDIRNFINEETIETHAHRGILEMIPDILTSLGILGTFIGLVMGLRSFDPSGYEQMAGSVTPLINGIKVAFITSIYGISLSLAFSFNLRSEFANLSKLVEEFLDTYYLHVSPPYEVDSLSRLLDGQKSRDEMTEELTTIFVEQMGKSFEQVITPAYERMTAGIQEVVDSFTRSQTEALSQICESVIRQMRGELNQDFEQLSQTIQDLQKTQNSYVDFMDRSMARMQQTFVTLQEHMAEMEQYNSQSLTTLSAAQKDAQQIAQEQQATYQQYIRFMYETIDRFSAIWQTNNEKMQEYSDEIAKMGPVRSNLEIREDLGRLEALLQDVRKRQLNTERILNLSDSTEEMNAMMDEILHQLHKLEDAVNTPALFRSRRKK
jgi:hypothetical protein